MSNALKGKFSGSLLGGMLGDIIGAAVEAESPGYIRKNFRNLDEILALESVPELLVGEWEIGRFTDDTQMTLGVAEWLLRDDALDGKRLLEIFHRAYEPWRHYGSGTRLILESFDNARDSWADLATAMFPQGSYGNGSAMRVSPVGLFLHNDLRGIAQAARLSSVVTHSHYLAVQGAILQATAVAVAIKYPSDVTHFVRTLKSALSHFEDLGQDATIYRNALTKICEGILKKVPPAKMVDLLGNGIKAHEAVPMAIYCYLANPNSFENALEAAVFLGGDTDTIASMTGAISGAALGESRIPERWLKRARETVYTPERVRQVAIDLYEKGLTQNFRRNTSIPRRGTN